VTQNHCPACYANIDVSWNSCPSCQESLYFYGKTESTEQDNSEALEAAKLEYDTYFQDRMGHTRHEARLQKVKTRAKQNRAKEDGSSGWFLGAIAGIAGLMLGLAFGA
jgi:hypothetical protein